MRSLQTPNHELSRVLIALVAVLAVVAAVYCWPTNLFIDLAVPAVVVGVLILLRTRP